MDSFCSFWLLVIFSIAFSTIVIGSRPAIRGVIIPIRHPISIAAVGHAATIAISQGVAIAVTVVIIGIGWIGRVAVRIIGVWAVRIVQSWRNGAIA